jgi:hypothetical protein
MHTIERCPSGKGFGWKPIATLQGVREFDSLTFSQDFPHEVLRFTLYSSEHYDGLPDYLTNEVTPVNPKPNPPATWESQPMDPLQLWLVFWVMILLMFPALMLVEWILSCFSLTL